MNRSLLALLVLAACGDDATVSPDARPVADARTDVDAPADASPSCTYTEQADTTNDTTATGGVAETSNITLSSARTTVCGVFASDHFDGDITVDVDAYRIIATADVDLVMRLVGNAGPIEYAGVDIYGGPTFSTLVATVTFYGDHGVGTAHVPPGTYELTPFALSSAAISADIPYTVELVGDDPATRCPTVTTGGYAEANDGAASTGNDVYAIPMGAPIALTAATTDAPELTGITLAPLVPTRVTGALADVTLADQYEDRDAFTFTTGATTNEITLRTTWTGATNVDFWLFEGTTLTPEFRALSTAAGVELKTYSLKPITTYTVLVGGKANGVFPTTYVTSICGAAYP